MKSAAGSTPGPEQKKASLSHYQQAVVPSSHVKVEKSTTATPSSTRQFCCRFNVCFGIIGSVVSTNPHPQQQCQQQPAGKQLHLQLHAQPTSKLEHQV